MSRAAARSALAVTLLLGFLPAAQADIFVREVRGWQIVISDEYKGCVASAGYRDGTRVRFGVDGITGNAFINFSNRDWNAYPLQQNFEIAFDVGRGNRFSGYFHTVLRDGLPTFENGELSPNFIEAFAGGAGMRLLIDGAPLTSFMLSGTRAAVMAVHQCERER